MIVDTSVLIAIIFDEPERQRFLNALLSADELALSSASYVEAGLRLDAQLGRHDARLDELIETTEMHVIPISWSVARRARRAARIYGKGQHPAQLNFGDLLVYALAMERNEPLLFKGDDFNRTDVRIGLSG